MHSYKFAIRIYHVQYSTTRVLCFYHSWFDLPFLKLCNNCTDEEENRKETTYSLFICWAIIGGVLEIAPTKHSVMSEDTIQACYSSKLHFLFWQAHYGTKCPYKCIQITAVFRNWKWKYVKVLHRFLYRQLVLYSQVHKYWDIDTILIFLGLYTTTMDLKLNKRDYWLCWIWADNIARNTL